MKQESANKVTYATIIITNVLRMYKINTWTLAQKQCRGILEGLKSIKQVKKVADQRTEVNSSVCVLVYILLSETAVCSTLPCVAHPL